MKVQKTLNFRTTAISLQDKEENMNIIKLRRDEMKEEEIRSENGAKPIRRDQLNINS